MSKVYHRRTHLYSPCDGIILPAKQLKRNSHAHYVRDKMYDPFGCVVHVEYGWVSIQARGMELITIL